MTRLKPARLVSIATGITTVALTFLATTLTTAARADERDDLSGIRGTTARYHDLAVAEASGYALLTDAAGIACIDNPGVGTMGVHYVNSTLIDSATVDPARPQALVFEPTDEGLNLVAVEYVVMQAAWDATHSSPPTLFGQQFMLTPAGNRYGLPAFYALHAWIWSHNPSGRFSMWNPRVSCLAPLGLQE